jgi:hypothetical protein
MRVPRQGNRESGPSRSMGGSIEHLLLMVEYFDMAV